jgi:hypothetical protein
MDLAKCCRQANRNTQDAGHIERLPVAVERPLPSDSLSAFLGQRTSKGESISPSVTGQFLI